MQVRPSPWRQAVDLANMMLVLAVRTDARRVYDRALQFFTPAEIGEAFAAARGVASPSQLRAAMKKDGRDLVTEFRAMTPAQPAISLQRWSPIRAVLAIAVILGAILAVQVTFSMLSPLQSAGVEGTPSCGRNDLMILVAQSVPTATAVPCVAAVPAGWTLTEITVDDGETNFAFDSDVAGTRAIEVSLLPPGECATGGATEVPSDEVGYRRFERIEQLRPTFRGTRIYRYSGGCVTYDFALATRRSASVLFDADTALAFQPRAALVREVEERNGLSLCGAHAPPCPGGQR